MRVVPERAQGPPFRIAFVFPETGKRHLISIANGVMFHETGVTDLADATLVTPRRAAIGMVGGRLKAVDLLANGIMRTEGGPAMLKHFREIFEPPRPDFPLVTP